MDKCHRRRLKISMLKKIIVIISLLLLSIFTITYFQQYSLGNFSIVEVKIEKNNVNYKEVKNASEFEEALLNPEVEIIKIENDIDLGYNVIKDELKTNMIFEEHNLPVTHPKLKETGVSKLNLENKDNLIIYSENGSSILHCNIRIKNCNNIKISNLRFEELWEWDEEGKAEYDRNDWDYVTIRDSQNICISNCEFSKSYDGIIDMKSSKDITIEYCKLNPIGLNDEFFDEQFEYLEKNKEEYEMYKFLRDEINLTYEEVKELFSYQFKVFLIENNEKNSNIIIHDCLFLDAKTRIPLIRDGMVYVYNVYANSENITKMMRKLVENNQFNRIKEKYNKVVALNSYGIIATENSYVFAKNTVFEGAKYPYVEYEKTKGFEGIGNIIIYNERKEIKNLEENLEKTVGVKSE